MPANSGCGCFSVDRVPADLRDFQAPDRTASSHDVAGDPAETLGDGLFQPARRHQLHADADAEERPRLAIDGLLDRLDHAGTASRPGRQSA